MSIRISAETKKFLLKVKNERKGYHYRTQTDVIIMALQEFEEKYYSENED